MTHKRLVTELDAIIDTACERLGLNPAIGAKKGDRESANTIIGLALRRLAETILEEAGAPAPVLPAQPAVVEAA